MTSKQVKFLVKSKEEFEQANKSNFVASSRIFLLSKIWKMEKMTCDSEEYCCPNIAISNNTLSEQTEQVLKEN